MDKNFRDLLTRFVNGTCTPEEQDQVNYWYKTIADQNLELEEQEKRLIEGRMLANIRKEVVHDKVYGRQRILFKPAYYKVAATALILAVGGLWFFLPDNLLKGPGNENVAQTTTDITLDNTSDVTRIHLLPDGSTVKLEPLSRLRFAKDLSGSDRKVYLTGKAFFDIVKDSSRPFYVYSGKIVTRVLGTSFFVDAPADGIKVGVKVVTGKVSVFPLAHAESVKARDIDNAKSSTANGVVLSPNQQVDYYIEEGHWITGLVEDPVPVKSIDAETLPFVFSSTPVEEILADIYERFGIEVVAENQKIAQCTFTGDVSRMPLYDMLDVISNSIGATYEVKGTRILVSGNGCNDVHPENIMD